MNTCILTISAFFSSNYRNVLRILMRCSFAQTKSHKCAFELIKIYKVTTTTAVGVLNSGLIKCIQFKSTVAAKCNT